MWFKIHLLLGWMIGCKLRWFSTYWRSAQPDVLKRPKKLYPKIYLHLHIFHHMTYATYHQFLPTPQMAPKKKQSMALSRKKIEAERVNVQLRTKRRIAQLYADAGRSEELELKDWHCCLNTFCFCMLLLCMNLLFCQWLYLKSTVTVNKV